MRDRNPFLRALLIVVVGLAACSALIVMCGCNIVTFEEGSIAPSFTIEPTGADSNEEGGPTGGAMANQGKLSPSSAMILDGYAQFAIQVSVAGETPTDAKVDATVTP